MTSHYATAHATERAIERYGIAPTRADWCQALLDILAAVEGHGPAMLLGRAHGVERWAITLCGKACIVLYRPTQAMILTTLLAGRPERHLPTLRRQHLVGRTRRERDLVEEWT